ncbi:MAG: spore cortex-lytic protein [Anaerovorax sp.]
MSRGFITAQVITSRSAIPIEDATLTVTQFDGDGERLKGFRTTNREGLTTPIEIETPDVNLSLRPSVLKPFTSCNLKVYHPNYYTLLVENAQVFPGETSLEIAELIPLKEFESKENSTILVDVIPQNL